MRLPLIAFAAVFSASVSFAGETEIRAAQAVIDGQLKAFQSNDAAAAYALAAPDIKKLFPSAAQFMQMVATAYPPVRRPRNHAFGKVQEMSETSIAQQVLLQGADGKDYEAIYTLQRQSDGRYLITGVRMRGATTIGI